MFLYDFATKTAQKPDTVATYIRRNEKIFKNHVERREKQLWLDEKAIDKLKRQVKEQGEKIELLEREISVLQNEKKSFFGFKRR